MNPMEPLRKLDLGHSLGSLPALVLAGALCFSMSSPALADFESAVAAYERGAYQEAQTEFEALAATGDERAQPYLERIQKEGKVEPQTEGDITSTVTDTILSIFSESETSSESSESATAPRVTGWFDVDRSSEGASDSKPADWEPWSPFDESKESAWLADADVVAPQHKSIWTTVFHLPGDATVIGLQYVARFLKADNLSRELQSISDSGNYIALGILAGLWWLVIIRGVIGICIGVSRFMKATTSTTERSHYG